MMNEQVNPFRELYVSETTDPKEYVELFSPVLVPHAPELFQKGNVVLKGIQGCGKTMLLSLLKPEVRIAYHDTGAEFPVPQRLTSFFSAGINISTSGILDLGQRRIGKDDERLYPLYFADFFNYWIVDDMLAGLHKITQRPDVFKHLVNPDSIPSFVQALSCQDCWFGYLDGVKTLDEMRARIDSRIASYRSFHNENALLPKDIAESKTTIGEPIARTAQMLKTKSVLAANALVLIRVDQLEELTRGDYLRKSLGPLYRQMINKALSPRDRRVFYRIGTRPYAWDDELTVYGSENRLELHRDYQLAEFDEMLRRRENRKDWRYPALADDTFKRRLAHAKIPHDARNPFKLAFKRERTSEQAAVYYVGATKFERIFRFDDRAWHSAWPRMLRGLFPEHVLEAKLAYGWALQSGGTHEAKSRHERPPPQDRPWQTRTWWRKERIRQALMQLAGACSQRLEWSGNDAIYALSTGNILVFLRICQGVWERQERANRDREPSGTTNFLKSGFEHNPQARGIEAASGAWFEKTIEATDRGTDQRRFAAHLGRLFYTALYQDEAMSYPGHNGFSLTVDELASWPELERFLQSMVDWGTLVEAAHTTKHRDRRQRKKWYLHPILSPFFKIPESHAKEPMYVALKDIATWLKDAAIILPHPPGLLPPKRLTQQEDLPLFADLRSTNND